MFPIATDRGMLMLLWVISWLVVLVLLAYHRVSLLFTAVTLTVGLVLTTFFSPFHWLFLSVMWILFAGIALFFIHPDYKRKWLVMPVFSTVARALPRLSETEKIALEAGTVGWEGELFSGQPQWEKLLSLSPPKLSEEETAFLEGPVQVLCDLINDWEITHVHADLPQAAWDFLKKEGFFGLRIPKKYGGKGFCEWAHSEILTTLAGRSLTLGVTVSVPNSLGPAELLLHYGTPAQQDYYLPRLAKGKEIPCFALTAPEAGSDATAISDSGIVCKKQINGETVTGILLNWDKRYITLAPIATLLGLAFKLYDPDHLLGDKEDIGITCALIPVHTPGITIGRRHFPLNIPFQNGPTQGKDVFIPLDNIIGGEAMAGQGWRMLIECLSTGRAISLPSLSTGGAKVAAFATGAYASIRRQFHTPLCDFEGIQEALGRIGGFTYLCEATRHLTIAMIDAGERPTVPGAISKYHVTEMSRKIANDAMDVQAGKGIMLGPQNYLARTYQGVPIGITVEGANILTRSMIIFGQGAIRCHPYLLKEMQTIEQHNVEAFGQLLGEHLGFTLSNAARAFCYAVTCTKVAKTPSSVSPALKPYFQQLTRASSAFALVSDVTLALLGGKFKFKEALSGKLGDLLAMMYLMSAVLKRYHDQGTPPADFPFVQWALDYCLAQFWRTMSELLHNLPHRFAAWALRWIVMPFGSSARLPQDHLNQAVTQLLSTTNEARSRLLSHIFISGAEHDPLARLDKTFHITLEHASLLKRIHDAIRKSNVSEGTFKQSLEAALHAKIITEKEAQTLFEVDQLCQTVIAVDDFSPQELYRE